MLRSLILVTTAGAADLDAAGLSELPFLEGSRRRVVFVTFRRIILELYPVASHVLLLVVVQVALLVRLGVYVDRRMLLDLDLVHGFERVGNGGR